MPPEQPALKFRGVRPLEASKPKAVSLTIQFEFGSAQLTPDPRTVLNNLGPALKSQQLSANVFLIEGHTDSVGSEAYNTRLSEDRARSVRDYLVSTFGIEPSRLDAVGRGKSDPLDRQNPESPLNRRVQIVNIR